MNRKTKLLLVLALIASALTLVTCKPIDYYLQRVYKAYGKVTDAKTGKPLESAEVFVKGYQYSELTNGLGDYEIELAEGTWTLEFAKEGYSTAESEPFQVGPTLQRKEVNATLSLIQVKQYTLTVLSGGNGTTSPSGNITVDHGSATNISATPATNYQFVNWTVASGTGAVFGDANSSDTTVTLASGDATIQANFVVAKYIGIWFGKKVEIPGPPWTVDVKITLSTNGTYETLQYNVDGSTLLSGSSRGTYTCANNILSAQQTEQYNGSAWDLVSGTPPPGSYSVSEDGNTLTLFQDFDQNGTTDSIWTLTRQ
jgi:hypothetical protein